MVTLKEELEPYGTLPETNIVPENEWLEMVRILISFWGPAYFQVRLMLVLGSVADFNGFNG